MGTKEIPKYIWYQKPEVATVLIENLLDIQGYWGTTFKVLRSYGQTFESDLSSNPICFSLSV